MLREVKPVCPDCGKSMNKTDLFCGVCGWKKPQAELSAVLTKDARCSYHGTFGQCARLGTVSKSVNGGGVFFCYDHFMCDSHESGDEIVEQSKREQRPIGYTINSVVSSVREMFRKTRCDRPVMNGGMVRKPGKWWAEDILKHPDYFPERSREIARGVLGVKKGGAA